MISAFLLWASLVSVGQVDGQIPDELKPGVKARITTAQDVLTGIVQDSPDKSYLKLKTTGSGEIAAVRRSAIQTVRLLNEGAPGSTANSNKHLVYVHGICKHNSGFWKPWWASMKPYASQIPEANIHEVVWSDVVNAPGAIGGGAGEEEQRLDAQIRSILEDRQSQESASVGDELDGEGAPGSILDDVFGCTDDFVLYMTRPGIRNQILARFNAVVVPLLQQGAEIEIISHSWGTVIAYEGLRNLDGQAQLSGSVHNFFTVGSALSIGPVRKNLADRVQGGQKPNRNTLGKSRCGL